MNPTLEVLYQRRSVRAYSDQPVTPEEKEAVLKATFRAPTAGNMMLYSIIEVEDQALKERLAITCDNQPFIARAPWVLLFLADYQRWYDIYLASGVEQRCQELGRSPRLPQEGDLMLACCDALIAAQTAVIAAEALGIGSCYIGDILENYETHREMFNLPRYVFPITLLCFGHTDVQHMPNRLNRRFDSEFIVHRNAYQRLDEPRMQQMLQPWEELFYAHSGKPGEAQNFGQGNYFRKFIADFSLEMTRSVRAMLKNWSE